MFEEICILFSTCGKNLDHERAKKFNKVKYFLVLEAEKENKENGMRVCFKIQDLLNLYQNNWDITVRFAERYGGRVRHINDVSQAEREELGI